MFKINDGYKLELQRPETLNLFGSTKVNRQKKNRRKTTVPGLEVVEVVLVQRNLVDKQHHQSIMHFYSK